MGGMGALVQHVWHGRKGVSKGCLSGGIFAMGSVFAMSCCGWYECNCFFMGIMRVLIGHWSNMSQIKDNSFND